MYELRIADVVGNLSVDLFSGTISWPAHLEPQQTLIVDSVQSLPFEHTQQNKLDGTI
jgi:hypothetical protein